MAAEDRVFEQLVANKGISQVRFVIFVFAGRYRAVRERPLQQRARDTQSWRCVSAYIRLSNIRRVRNLCSLPGMESLAFCLRFYVYAVR